MQATRRSLRGGHSVLEGSLRLRCAARQPTPFRLGYGICRRHPSSFLLSVLDKSVTAHVQRADAPDAEIETVTLPPDSMQGRVIRRWVSHGQERIQRGFSDSVPSYDIRGTASRWNSMERQSSHNTTVDLQQPTSAALRSPNT